MKNEKTTFALFFGNRGFFPASLMKDARRELSSVLKKLGHKTLMLDEAATRHGAVETVAEGRRYAEFLREHRGQFGGVVVSLPNFGDENGAVAALKDAGVPILIQAYPDDLDKMRNELRRDAFCGKFSIMDVFCQNAIPFTALKPHTVRPSSARFAANVDHFDRVCRVAGAMRNMTVGAIGARTTAFKTVRIDELALQKYGITVETIDLLEVFKRMEAVERSSKEYRAKAARLKKTASWDGVPDSAFDKLTRLGVVVDGIVEEFGLDAVAIRCWLEMQKHLGISPCVLNSEMNERGLPAACEVDLGNAIAMRALSKATGATPACLDWNNNYGDDDNKCILFHCGPAPASMMTATGRVTDHEILANAVGKGCGYGCNTGRLAPAPFTFGSLVTDAGKLRFYVGEARFTADPIPDDFFGVAGVAEFDDLQSVLQHVGYGGHRHHVSVAPGLAAAPIVEAFERYLGYEVTAL